MNQNQTCSRCGAPLSSDVVVGVCDRCRSSANTTPSDDSATTAFRTAVAAPDQPETPSTFLDEVFSTTGKTFELLFQKPYIWAAFAFGFYKKWKDNPRFTWGIVGWSAVVFVGLIVVYSVLRAAFPRVVAFLNADPSPQPPLPPPLQTESSPNGNGWWLLHDGRPTGPHSLSHLLDAAERGDFALDALVCPVGSQQWSALRTVLPPPLAANRPTTDSPTTN